MAMKLALIGGGGVRAPEFVSGALAFVDDLDWQELWLMDADPERLRLIVPLCEQIIRQAGVRGEIRHTTRLAEALQDAHLIVTSIRVGQEGGRILDERIALRHGVLGQETTGAGGFSMAIRSIPAILEIASQAEQLAPGAWLLNFTNPAGLVTQTLHDAGFRRVVGICDSANTAQNAIAAHMGLAAEQVKTTVFGLNHLSWTRSALVAGRDVLPDLLQDEDFIQKTHLRFFGRDLVEHLGMFLNEYLYYFYFRDLAVERIREKELTRGEEVQMLNKQLFEQLRGHSAAEALAIHHDYTTRRNASYMAYAEADADLRQKRSHPAGTETRAQAEVGGYAGVALRTGVALLRDRPRRIALNVANEGAIKGMQPDDVVEVTCLVDGRGVHPLHVGAVPEDAYLLMRAVKRYERLASQAIRERDRETAVDALAAHPLVGSFNLARMLVDQYLDAHKNYIGDWH